MSSTDRVPLELTLEVVERHNQTIRLTKTVYAGFVPQHGMEIIDTELIFKVRTMALAGLDSVRHTANPLRKGNWVEGSRKITSKLFPKNEEQLKESIQFFIKQGWKVEQ